MSKRPFGPWTDAANVTVNTVSGGELVQWNNVDPNPGPPFPYAAINITNSDSRSGVNQGPTGPYVPANATLSLVEQQCASGLGDWTYQYDIPGGFPSRRFGKRIKPRCPVPSLEPNVHTHQQLVDKAFSAFVKKTHGKSGQFQSLVFAGEFGSLVDDVRFLTKAITGAYNKGYQDLVKDLFKFKPKSLTKAMTLVSDNWIRVRFGLVPDVNDLTQLVKSVADTSGTTRSYAISGRFSDKSSASSTVNTTDQWGIWSVQTKRMSNTKYLAKVGGTLADVPYVPISVSERFGFGLEDFAPAMWELLPYSWLVDYFSNVGDIVGAAALRKGVYDSGWSVSVIEQIASNTQVPTGVVVGGGSVTNKKYSGNASSSTHRSFEFNRGTLNLDTTVPSFRMEVPDLMQAANIAAVAVLKLSPYRLNWRTRTR